jgi:Ca2+-binding RTX toxin-like protein
LRPRVSRCSTIRRRGRRRAVRGHCDSGADTLTGGPGFDFVAFSERTVGVTVNLNGLRDDGQSGEHDLVSGDVESVLGGSGNDLPIGSNGVNHLTSGGDNDELRGLCGGDRVFAGTGVDVMTGGSGTDTIFASDSTADDVRCDQGVDTASIDEGIDSVSSCESTV